MNISYISYPPTIKMENTEMKEVKKTQNVAEAAALDEGIPNSSHNGVSVTPPPVNLFLKKFIFIIQLPKPTKPPRKPAIKLACTV